ncbi:hypothetical protein BGZ76_002201 [Entomortierella beljakovae]|nr:hypothetical protein BGZ76_002201 [Entomortierella beljakovae]
MRKVLEETRNRTGTPGMSIAVLHKGKLVFAEGFGKRNAKDPFTVDTLSQIASVTKAFTATAIGELVGEGKMDWDVTPVSKYLPEFELQDPTFTSQITIQDMLAHRTGFPMANIPWFSSDEPRRELVKKMKYIETGSKLSPFVLYNNAMYAIAGEAAANVEGVPFEELVHNKVLSPLGLNNSGFTSKEMSKHRNYALPHSADSFKDAQNGKFNSLPLSNIATAASPAGDMYSNVLDLVRWGESIMHYGKQDGRQVLNKDSVEEMLSGQSIFTKTRRTSDFAPIKGYGMGWMLDTYKGNILYHHSGHIDGFVSHLALFPDSELVVAHLANIMTSGAPMYSAFYFADELLGLPISDDWMKQSVDLTRDDFDAIAENIKGNFPPRIKGKPPTHKPNELIGKYSHPAYGDINVYLGEDTDDELLIRFKVYEGRLEHFHYDSFRTVMRYSATIISELVTFETGEDGAVAGLHINLELYTREARDTKSSKEYLYEIIDNARVRAGVPGLSVAVLHKGKLVFADGFGKRNEHEPFTAETLMPIASVTKAFTAAAVGELVAEGKLDWDTTPVSKYLPEFELADPIQTAQLTLQDLLSHRTVSNLFAKYILKGASYFGVPVIDFAWFWSNDSYKDLIKIYKNVKAKGKINPYVRYSNGLYAVAGYAAANVAGISYEDLVFEKILKPLGLNNTHFSTEEMAKHPNYASPYSAGSFEDTQNGNFRLLELDNMSRAGAPAGDLHSNVFDLVRWGNTVMHYGMQDGKQVLSKDSIKEILTAQSIYIKGRRTADFGATATYGMGWILDSYKGNVMYHHGGHVFGYITYLALFPDQELVIAHLSNIETSTLSANLVYLIADEILGLSKTQDWTEKAIQDAKDGFKGRAEGVKGDLPRKVKNSVPSHPLSDFIGDYHSPIYGKASIDLRRNDEGKEVLYFKLRVMEGGLEHYHYDSFVAKVSYSALAFTELLTFSTGQDGSISSFKIKMLGEPEVFERK